MRIDQNECSVQDAVHTVSMEYGEPLTHRDLEAMAMSWITPEIAEAARLRRVDSSTGREIVGRAGSGDYSGILFPYYWPGNLYVRAYRLRRDYPDLELQPDGTTKEKGKYLSAPGQRSMFYFAPNTESHWLDDVTLSVVLVEGEKKALALSRLALYNSEGPRFLPLGVAGVWGWRGKVGKTLGPNGELRDVRGPSPDFDRIAWRGRLVTILFDSNVTTNESVNLARRELTRVLRQQCARVLWSEI